ncbi:MAG: hypothetical protein J6V78_02705 [Clostridia bacterium]|nr:hypothetical protein [Clostridia bacterium]
MKKKLSVFLAVLMLMTVAMPISVYAKNGPYKSNNADDSAMALISFVDVYGDISFLYPASLDTKGRFKNSKNISYDEKTNTLTLSSFKTDEIMVLTAMGDDFKIKLSGYNELGCIVSSDMNWGGSVTVTGSGALIVNEKGAFTDAVFVDGSGTGNAFFKVEKTVGVKLYKGSDSAVSVYGTSDDSEKIILEGTVVADQTTVEKYSKNIYEQEKVYSVNHYAGSGVFYGKTGAGNENKIFIAELVYADRNVYNVAEVVYDAELKNYVLLPMAESGKELVLEESGFIPLPADKYPADVLEISPYTEDMNVCIDENGKKCVFIDYSELSKPETDVEVYEVLEHKAYGKLALLYNPKKTYKELKKVKSENRYNHINFSKVITINTTPETVPSKVVLKSVVNAYGGLNVSWNTASGAESYKVYRKASTEKNWSIIANVTATSYLDKTAKTGVKYTYTVRGENVLGLGAFDSKGVSETYVASPSVAIANATNGIKVSWSTVSGSAGYTVYRSQYSGGKWSGWKNMGTAKPDKSSWTDKSVASGITYRYTVRTNFNKIKSGYQATNGLMVLSTPTVKISNASSGVNVTWSKVNGALNYTVYRAEYLGSKWSGWKQINTVGAVTNYIDTTAKSGICYKYTVRAVNGGSTGAYKASALLLYLAQPTVTIANASNGIKVSWSKSNGATGYTVYRSQYSGGKWSGWKVMGTAKADKSAWTDKSVKNGVAYKYTVRAINGNTKSTFTETAGLVRLANPTVKIANATTGVKVTWTKASGATGYIVYRSELVNGKWSSWKNLGKLGNVNSYVDATATSGITYKYTVKAFNGVSMSAYTASANLLYLVMPKVTVAEAEKGITVSWNASAGAKAYIVYRAEYDAKTKKWSSWEILADAVNGDSVAYTDITAVSGKTYRYTVRAASDVTKSGYASSADILKK